MQLLNTDITKFQALYKAQVGIELDYQAARGKLARLVRQVEIVYRPATMPQLKGVERRDGNNAKLSSEKQAPES